MFLITSLLLLAASSANASTYFSNPSYPYGYERGNGGNYVRCTDESDFGSGVFSLDRVEGLYLHNLAPSPEISGMSDENEIMNHVLSKVESVNPSRGQMYKAWLQEILEKRRFVSGARPEILNDGDVMMVPHGCKLEPGAIFVTNDRQLAVQFIFVKELWDVAPPVDRAYLMLHELIYREARMVQNRHMNSLPSRYLTAWLMAHKGDISFDSWLEIIKKIQFNSVEYSNVQIRVSDFNHFREFKFAPIKFYENSTAIEKAVLMPNFSVTIGGVKYSRKECRFPNEGDVEYRPRGHMNYVVFYKSGAIKQLAFHATFFSECSLDKLGNNIHFTEDGRISKIYFSEIPLFWEFND